MVSGGVYQSAHSFCIGRDGVVSRCGSLAVFFLAEVDDHLFERVHHIDLPIGMESLPVALRLSRYETSNIYARAVVEQLGTMRILPLATDSNFRFHRCH